VKRLLKHTAAAILLAVAATMLITTPASATQLRTSIETTSSVYDCPSTTGCFRHGNAPQGTLARSYCFIGDFDLVFSEGVANRFGFIAFTALVDKTQNTGCFNGGTQTSVNGDTPLRACANQNCGELSDLALADSLRAYCTRNDSAGSPWIAIFNTNGQHTGFTRRGDLNLRPDQSFLAC
jgi:hypothetical protein